MFAKEASKTACYFDKQLIAEQKRTDHVGPTITRGVSGRLPNTAQPPRAAG